MALEAAIMLSSRCWGSWHAPRLLAPAGPAVSATRLDRFGKALLTGRIGDRKPPRAPATPISTRLQGVAAIVEVKHLSAVGHEDPSPSRSPAIEAREWVKLVVSFSHDLPTARRTANLSVPTTEKRSPPHAGRRRILRLRRSRPIAL